METLADIRGCFETVSEAVSHLTADVADLKTRMASFETFGRPAPSTSYAAVAASPSARSTEFPPLGKPPNSQRRQRTRPQRQQEQQQPAARSRQSRTPAASALRANSGPPPLKSAIVGAYKRPPPQYTVFVTAPNDPDRPDVTPTAAELRSRLMTSVNPARDGIRVRHLRQTAGGRLVLEVNSAGDLAKLQTHEGLQASGLRIAPPTLKSPRVIIYDVPTDVAAEALTDAVWRQNPAVSGIPWPEFQEAFIPRHQLQKGVNTCHWVVSVSLAVRDKLRAAQRVFALWSRCRVLDYLAATRCFKCQDFGHVARHCRQSTDTCGHCAGDHVTTQCRHKSRPPVCAPCARRQLLATHDVRSNDCPTYKRAVRLELRRVDYG